MWAVLEGAATLRQQVGPRPWHGRHLRRLSSCSVWQTASHRPREHRQCIHDSGVHSGRPHSLRGLPMGFLGGLPPLFIVLSPICTDQTIQIRSDSKVVLGCTHEGPGQRSTQGPYSVGPSSEDSFLWPIVGASTLLIILCLSILRLGKCHSSGCSLTEGAAGTRAMKRRGRLDRTQAIKRAVLKQNGRF